MKPRHATTAALIVVLSMAICSTAAALTIPWETRAGYLSSGIYGWRYSYDIGVFDDTLMVDVDIALSGTDPGIALRSRWESGIESIWSTHRFEVPITFNVDWVSSNSDYFVTVVSGTGRWNMLTWYTVGAAGWGGSFQEEVAAHEYGHMISMWDEYAGGAVNPSTGLINTSGLMATLAGPTLDYYYDPFLAWYDERRAALAVSEPSTMILLGTGLGALLLAVSRTKL